MNSDIQSMFNDAKKIVFLTGAGVSTPSGIPDYRSKNGLYSSSAQGKPAEYYLSHACLVNEPETFYQFVKTNMYFPEAKPNVIHEKQAEFTQMGKASIITQNVDNLYKVANAKNLIEFHGNLYNVSCERCHKTVAWQDYLNTPVHADCGGILRPDIVLYDEGLNEQNIMNSINLMENSDLIVIVGTSMRVYPFAGLLDYRNPNAKVLAINKEQLHFAFPFEMIQADAIELFSQLNVN
ncbi:NAD-dependent protein deacylase [Apilactobacillus sp. TMW 2.2459]|jgi:NAD-dependent deacetylase|uniref:NAD-dependent protein deacylase n=1 Tax=Apilactobacillus xinyiensis TaxID=2841032 RepID=UPI00200E8688|nr:NAD-dependent protein deacylase [Apilactobacillus xinyiensis]MCL0312851.1 NAD-dependent protein deacylase [Apilactobacillus xinyiensis]